MGTGRQVVSGQGDALRTSLRVLRDRAQAEHPDDTATRDWWFWCAVGALLAGHESSPGPYPDDLIWPSPPRTGHAA